MCRFARGFRHEPTPFRWLSGATLQSLHQKDCADCREADHCGIIPQSLQRGQTDYARACTKLGSIRRRCLVAYHWEGKVNPSRRASQGVRKV